MRRPKPTKAQREHAREQRALLRLRRAAVRFSLAPEMGFFPGVSDAELLADLEAAADRYADIIPTRERKRLCR